MNTKKHREKGNLPEFVLLGISHKSAPVAIRERFALTADEQPGFFEKARAAGIAEMVCISTCNRVSMYFTAIHPDEALDRCIGLLEEHSGMDRSEFEPYLYRKNSDDAVRHLFNVTSSLDSMIIGENEILSQVKAAYRTAVQCKFTGMLMNRVFHQAFSTAKRVKTETDISQNPLSIAYIATEQAVKVLGDLADRRALLIGAGEMGELIVKYFAKQNIGAVTIANRSLHNAERIIKDFRLEANVITLDDIVENAYESDIVITSVTCQDYLITRGMAERIMKRRHGRALFMIDIAVPRNIDPAAREVKGVHLFNIDDLKQIADENMRNRLSEVELAKQIIAADTADFMKWYGELEVVPIITKMRRNFNEVRKKELEKYRRRKLKHLSDDDFKILEEMTHQIMTRTLHNPIMAIKRYQASKSSGHVDIETIVDELFKRIK
jgi:glutamyl-tRNA reductase